MPAPVPVALRERVIALYIPRVVTYEMIAELLGIGRATVSRILRLHRENGNVEPKPASGGTAPLLDERDRRELAELVEGQADATLAELTSAWNSLRPDRRVSDSTIWRALATMGYSWKKKRSEHGKWTKRRSFGSGRSSSRGSRTRTRRG